MPGEPTSRIADITGEMTVVEADLRSADLDRLVDAAPFEICVHLAWYVEPRHYLTAVQGNLDSLSASVRLLSAIERVGGARVILAGTCLESGTLVDGEPSPARTIYAAAKDAQHALAAHLARVSSACAHIFYLYGPGESERRIIPRIICSCLEGRSIDVSPGVQRRDFLHVDDVAAGLVAAAGSAVRGKLDICSGTSTELRDVFDAIGEATGRADLIRVGGRPLGRDEPLQIAGDGSALADTGWRPKWTLLDGVASTVEWWRRRLNDGLRTSWEDRETAPGD